VRAAQEAATLSFQAARISALNQQAQAHAKKKKAQKQQWAVRDAQCTAQHAGGLQ
jgi:hypothetical protein